MLQTKVWRTLFKELYKLDSRLNFKRSDIQGALTRQYHGHSEWPQGPAAISDYRIVVTKRVVNALDHFKSAFVRQKPASWALEVLGLDAQSAQSAPSEEPQAPSIGTLLQGDAIEVEDDGEEELDFFYGFSAEQRNAWRARADAPEGPREYATELLPGDGPMSP
eukprot:2198197-Lingulodinium_polyedra.AAC.1